MKTKNMTKKKNTDIPAFSSEGAKRFLAALNPRNTAMLGGNADIDLSALLYGMTPRGSYKDRRRGSYYNPYGY